MKIRCLFVILNLFLFKQGFSQCTAFAGNDTFICAGQPFVLDQASVTGGTPPYTYAWDCGRIVWFETASDYFEDTTVLHPTIIRMPSNSYFDYWLVVVDAAGDTCTDTVTVDFNYPYPYVNQHEYYINPSDSVELDVSPIVYYPPFIFQWEPVTGLSNPDTISPVAYPTETTTYAITITDSVGCTATTQIIINVFAVGNESRNEEEIKIDLLPNPTHNEIWLSFSQHLSEVEVWLFDSEGRKINSFHVSGTNIQIDTKQLKPGVFFLVVQQDGRVLGNQKFVRR